MTSSSDRGAALIVVMMAMLLLSALGAALVVVTNTEALIGANSGSTAEAFYAADAAFERTLAELKGTTDFTSVLSGISPSRFVDGPASGVRTLTDGSAIDLSQVEHFANCARRQRCSESELDATTRERPWGARNPRWRLYSWGPFPADSTGARVGPVLYVVSLVADDPSDTDGNPWQDGGVTTAQVNAGAGVVFVRAEAFGRRGAHRVIEGTVVRQDLVARARWDAADPALRGPAPAVPPILQVLAWREVR
jgi:hypothetical protein